MRLLFVANFPADTGYAWDTIEAVLRSVGERLVSDGHEVFVSYPAYPNGPPPRMRGAPFTFLTFDYNTVGSRSGTIRFLRLLREHRINALYLTDRPTWSPIYALFRAGGVRAILVHDRNSGTRAHSAGPLSLLKRGLHRIRAISVDAAIGVSGFVVRRLIDINGTAPQRTHLVYNGIDLQPFLMSSPGSLNAEIGAAPETPIVFCSGRVQPYKGFQVLLDAAAVLKARATRTAAYVVVGDGPYLPELRARAAELGLDNVFFLGRRSDVPRLVSSATVAVVPSLWAEAFGLTVVEAMAAGVPVIGARSGGIPELIVEGTGLLVPAGDSTALADALEQLLANPDSARAMGAHARAYAHEKFSLERVARELHLVVAKTLSAAAPAGVRADHPTTEVAAAARH